MKLLIVGASGVLGTRLHNDAIEKKWDTLGTYCSHEHNGLFYLDLRDKKSINKVFNFFNPEVVILTGGITDVDFCEIKPRLAEEINIKGSIDLIKKTKEYNAKLVFLSTDYIFDGENGPYTEEDNPSPINVYGRTKLEVEEFIRASLREYLIVRTAQLYGINHRGKNFAVKIIHNMQKDKKVYAADDFYCTPTYVGSLSLGIIKLIENHRKGIYNIAGIDFLNRYEYVNKISDIFNLKKSLIQKVKLKDLHLKAKRPEKTGLKVDKIKKELDMLLYSCDKGLRLLKKEI